jgi:SAM-dependent methyltransferase
MPAMTQTWDPKAYEQNGAFVHGLAGGVLEWLDAKAAEHILDLGCGDGQLTQRSRTRAPAFWGWTPRRKWSRWRMVAVARARGVVADVASAEALPYARNEFDSVFSNAALHWMRDQDAMMAEVRRVLKPGGRFVAEMGGQGNIAAIRVALMAVLARHGFGDREDGVNYYPTADGYSRRLVRHGFDVQRIALIPRPTPLAESGMAGWLRTFRRGVLEGLPEAIRDRVVEETSALLAPALRDEDGKWTADYVRLRFIAMI